MRRLLLMLIWLGVFSSANAAQPPARIEETVPQELAQRDDIAKMISRLKFLRISLDRLGKKHPSRNAVVNQIKKLESRLENAISVKEEKRVEDEIPTDMVERYIEQATKSHESSEIAPSAQDMEDVITPRREAEPRNEQYSETTTFAPTASRRPMKISDQPTSNSTESSLEPAFPNLEFENLTAIGPFPARGLLWGIEFDRASNMSKVWQWQDHQETREKVLYWKTAGEVRDFEFDHDFESSGAIYVTRVTRESSEERLDVVRLKATPLPPFEHVDDSEIVIATAKGRFAQRHIIAPGGDGGVYIAASESQFDVVQKSTFLEPVTKFVTRINLQGNKLWDSLPTLKATPPEAPIQLLNANSAMTILEVKHFQDHAEIASVASEPNAPRTESLTISGPSSDSVLAWLSEGLELKIDGVSLQAITNARLSMTARGNENRQLFLIWHHSKSAEPIGIDSKGELVLLDR